MENKLTFSSIHKSIVRLPEIDLPKFVVLTGKNGSGKTHLLEAIKQGSVKSTLVVDTNSDVLLFDWNNIIPKDTGVFHPYQHQTLRTNWFTQIRTLQGNCFPSLRQQAINLGIPDAYCSTLQKLQNLDANQLENIFPNDEKTNTAYKTLQEQLKLQGRNIHSQSRGSIGDDFYNKMASIIANEEPERFLESSEEKFFNNQKFLWGEVDPFEQAFGRLFSTYRDLIHKNDRLEKYPPVHDSDLKCLNDNEFLETYGEPPWEFVNNILKVCNLDFRVETPLLHENSSYEPKLNKISTDIGNLALIN